MRRATTASIHITPPHSLEIAWARPQTLSIHTASSPEPLNENETVIGISEESCPKPLRLFEAWNASMSKLSAQAAKFAQAEMQQHSGDEHSAVSSVAKQDVAKEVVQTSIAVDMIEIARGLTRSKANRAELQSTVAAQAENEQQPHWQCQLESPRRYSILLHCRLRTQTPREV